MDQSTAAVETNENQAASSQGVETSSSAAPHDDPEARIEALIKENEKLARDRDNYRSATLAMKGKAETQDMDLTDPVQLASYVQNQVEAKLAATRENQAQVDLTNYARDLARKNKELATALANRSGVTNAGQGSGTSEGSESKVGFFSTEQLNEFKKRGWSDEKIKLAEKNMRK